MAMARRLQAVVAQAGLGLRESGRGRADEGEGKRAKPRSSPKAKASSLESIEPKA